MVNSILAITLLLLHASSAAHGGNGTIFIESVNPGSPAETAGMQAGDSVVRLDGRELASYEDLKKIMAAHRPGDTVPLTVQRDGAPVDLSLTFGERPDGGVSIGVRLRIEGEPAAGSGGGEGTAECLAWIDKTYRIDSMTRDLGLKLSDDYETIRACVERDTSRMSTANAIKYCDNVFKVHCSGLDLVSEIGEAQVRRCDTGLSESLGLNVKQYKGWSTCAEQKVFERYSMAGESSDEDACRATLLDECGTNIDVESRSGKLSPEQRSFAECCSADTLGPESHGASGNCRMIDDGFTRGPCHDHPVCMNRMTSEWLHCPVRG